MCLYVTRGVAGWYPGGLPVGVTRLGHWGQVASLGDIRRDSPGLGYSGHVSHSEASGEISLAGLAAHLEASGEISLAGHVVHSEASGEISLAGLEAHLEASGEITLAG